MGKEKDFETNKVKCFLKSKGIYPLGLEKQKMTIDPIGYYEKRFANRNTKRGLPDMHIVIHGQSFEVELKAENGTASDLQIAICNQIRNSGGNAFILYPSGYGLFKKIIEYIIINKSPIKNCPLILKEE